MTTTSRLVLTAALALPNTLAAQSAIELDEALVTSGLIPVAVGETGATVEILDDDEIADGAATLDDTLERLPGVAVTRTGTPGSNADLRIRGLPQRYTGVTIDGIDVIDPSAPQAALNFGTMTRALADRIEVAKGTQTAVYGSDAIAGTVNITSWQPAKDGLSWGGQAEAGSFGWVSSVFHLGYLDDRGEAALTLGAARSDGYSARPGNGEADGFHQETLSFRLSRNVTDSVTLGVNGFWTDSAVEDDDGDTNPVGDYFETRMGLRAFAEVKGDRVDHAVSVSRYVIEREDPTGFSRLFEGRRTEVDYLGTTDLSANATLAFGADWVEEGSDIDGSAAEADNWAVFAEVQYAMSDRADVSMALRHDVHSDFDDATTGRVALAYRLSDATTLKAVLGTGFRAPSLYERFGPFGNTALQAEESRSAEIGIAHDGGNWAVEAVAFRTEIDNLIGFGAANYIQTPGETVADGVELSGEIDLGRVSLFGNYTYTRSDGPTGRSLRVPRRDIVLGAEAALTDKLDAAVSVRRVEDRLDIDGSFATVAAPDYTVADALLTYEVRDGMDVYLRVENIFDEAYQEVLTYTSPGRSVFVGLNASF
ncbi:MAG: TonB-dependent receptor [Silicimonas sp.]|nr:TonB-dependent receptor [Silicimonas sp.]